MLFRSDPLTSKVRGSVVLNADLAFDVNRPLAPAFLANELVPITYFDYLQAQIAKQAQEAFEAIQVQNAVIWSRVQTPVIVAKDDAVQIVEAKFKVEELAGTDPKGPGNLRITKLADLKIAAQDRWLALFASHPPLEARIRALQALEPAETAMHWLR